MVNEAIEKEISEMVDFETMKQWAEENISKGELFWQASLRQGVE